MLSGEILNYLFAHTSHIEEEAFAMNSEQWIHRNVFDIFLWHEGG